MRGFYLRIIKLKTMNEMEKILDKIARKRMVQWNLNSFKETHPHLFKTIIEAMNEASKNLVKPDVIKSVCPKCKSDDWDDTTKNNRRCNMCGERWQTVL